MEETKTCTKCGECKPCDEFSRDRKRKDGLQPWCKACLGAAMAKWNQENPQYGKGRYAKNTKRERAHSKRWREANPERYRELQKASRARNRETQHEARRRSRARHPEKAKARAAVNNAVYRGKLFKPPHCEKCGEETESQRLHAHHHDYSKPFEVEWLCFDCHRLQHAEEAT